MDNNVRVSVCHLSAEIVWIEPFDGTDGFFLFSSISPSLSRDMSKFTLSIFNLIEPMGDTRVQSAWGQCATGMIITSWSRALPPLSQSSIIIIITTTATVAYEKRKREWTRNTRMAIHLYLTTPLSSFTTIAIYQFNLSWLNSSTRVNEWTIAIAIRRWQATKRWG